MHESPRTKNSIRQTKEPEREKGGESNHKARRDVWCGLLVPKEICVCVCVLEWGTGFLKFENR